MNTCIIEYSLRTVHGEGAIYIRQEHTMAYAT